jgi:hypothetical protein
MPAERSSLTQSVQIGVEVTPGTSVAANKKFNSTGIEPAIQVDMQRFRPMGTKYATVEVEGKEWVEADINGVADYTEMTYLLSSLLVTPAAPAVTDVTAYTWTWTPSSTVEDTVTTYTVEQGGAVRAHKFSYGVISELEIDLKRDGCETSGSMLGQRISDGIAMTVGPTTVTQKPILPTDIDVYMDPTSGALGTTKLTRVLNANIHISDRFGPVWVLNTANNSYVATVETEPSAELTLLVEADAAGMGLLTQLRAGSTKFVRVKATSPDLAGNATAFYSFQWDAAVKVKDVGNFSDEDGVYAIEWTMDMVHDGTWGKAYTAVAINKLAAL